MRAEIPDTEVAELIGLYRQLPPLVWEATNRIKIDPRHGPLTGSDLDRYRAANARVVSVIMQIIDISGR